MMMIMSNGSHLTSDGPGAGHRGNAASPSPQVKGEKSENRGFWSTGDELPAPFRVLEFGRGVTDGGGTGERRQTKVSAAEVT